MPTIEDVAKRAGLSRTTVSRVLNDHPYVSEEKKELVRRAMDELGYVPNSSARRLRNQKTETIAVFIPRITNPFFSALLEAMEIAAVERGYKLIMCQTRYSKEMELEYLDLLRTKQVDGIILASIQNEWALIQKYTQYGPIILCNEYDDAAEVPMVRLNHKYGGYMAAKHLLELGHDRIAYCSGGNVSNVGKDREGGFVEALMEFGKTVMEEAFFRDAINVEDGKRVFTRIEGMDDPPTAVFTGSDEVAAGLIHAAKQRNWRIPEDIAVVGFDNQTISELTEPPISTVAQPIEEMAKTSIDVIIHLIRSNKTLKREIYEFPLQLVVRESTAGKTPLTL